MRRKKWTRNSKKKRILITLLVVIMLVNLLVFNKVTVNAEPTGGGTSANATTRSMLEFFRTDRTVLNVDAVTKDELQVYGVFISNFFVPGQTTIKDISGDGDTSISKKVAEKFFGSASAEQTTNVKGLNTKISDAILKGLREDTKNFGLYKSKEDVNSERVMTGEDLYKMFAGSSRTILNGNGEKIFDLNDDAIQGTLQLLCAFSPELVFDKDKGLRSFTGLYIDGLGNIWASYNINGAKVTIEEYVLFLPACMNPIVFKNKNSNLLKLPLNNAFAMGAVLKTTENFLSNANFMTPYYNLKSNFTNGSSKGAQMNAANMASLMGVESPFSHLLGKSDYLILGNDWERNPANSVKEFVSKGTNSKVNANDTKIMLTMDVDKLTNAQKYFKDDSSLSTDEKSNLFFYFMGGNTYSMSNIEDTMYYFSGVIGANGDQGSWKEDDSLIKGQRLFFKNTNSSVPSEGQFYNGSYFASPFNKFLVNYFDKPESDRLNFLTNWIKSNTVNTRVKNTDAKVIALNNFLSTGDFKTDDVDVLNDAMQLFKTSSDNLVFNMLPQSNHVSRTVIESRWFGIITDDEIVGFGVTDGDYEFSYQSYAVRTHPKRTFSDPGLPDPFEFSNGGGKLTTADTRAQQKVGTLFHTFMTYRIFSMNSTFTQHLTGSIYAGDKYNGPGGRKFTARTAVMNDVNNWPGIYWGYMVSMLNAQKNEDGKWDSTPYSNNLLPYMVFSVQGGSFDLNNVLSSSGLSSTEDETIEEMQIDIIKKIYSLLSEGYSAYRDSLIKSTQDSWIISTHRNITGSWADNVLSVSAGGGGAYASVVGYINTPGLYEVPITSWILKDYYIIYALLLLIVIISLVAMCLTGVRTVREGLLIFVIMCGALLLPQYLLGNVIDLTNKVGDKIYSERFNYWAITQHQQSLTNLKSARQSRDEMQYIIAQTMENAKNVYSTDAGVRVRWMAPKKDNVFQSIFTDKNMTQSLQSDTTIFRWLFNSFFNQEEYVYNDPLATYLYRPYNAIVQEANNNFTAMQSANIDKVSIKNEITNGKRANASLSDYKFKYITNPNSSNIKYTDEQKNLINISKTYSPDTDIEKMEIYRYWIMSNSSVTRSLFKTNYDLDTNAGLVGYDSTDATAQSYLLATESPFYYFYNVFKTRYKSVNGQFKSALLTEDVYLVNQDNTRVDGKIRDFLDLEGLFTYVIPYLNQGNSYVHEWTGRHGSSVESFDFSQAIDSTKSAELIQEYNEAQLKKDAMEKVWKMYAPWVDQLYSLDVMNQKVSIARGKVYVEDTLDPASYEAVGRPMIFSEADMYAKNYSVSELSDVEIRIQRVLSSTYTDLMYLSNYYDFDDEVLISAAAMMATFNFNREFSETRIIGENTMLYPQSFELKNFNYDAFMRLTLLNATGEPLMAEEDLYVRVLSKTSVFTGILLLLKDITAVILIPAAKTIVMLMLLFLGLLITISCVVSPPEKLLKTLSKYILVPTVMFLGSNIIFAFSISLFMGEGLTGYVGGRLPTAGVTDPTITMLLMAILDIIYLYVQFKIIKLLVVSFKSFGSSTLFGTLALVAGATSMIGGKIKNIAKNRFSFGRNKYSSYSVPSGSSGSSGSGGTDEDYGFNDEDSSNSSGGIGYESSSAIDFGKSDSKNMTKGIEDEINRLASKPSDSTVSKTENSHSINSDSSIDINPELSLSAHSWAVLRHLLESDTSTISSKSIGHKKIDFKYSLKNVGDSVSNTAYKAYKGAGNDMHYLKDKGVKGIAEDVKDTAVGVVNKGKDFVVDSAKSGVDTVVDSAKSGVDTAVDSAKSGVDTAVGYYADLQEYDAEKRERMASRKRSLERKRMASRKRSLELELKELCKANSMREKARMTRAKAELLKSKKVDNSSKNNQ